MHGGERYGYGCTIRQRHHREALEPRGIYDREKVVHAGLQCQSLRQALREAAAARIEPQHPMSPAKAVDPVSRTRAWRNQVGVRVVQRSHHQR